MSLNQFLLVLIKKQSIDHDSNQSQTMTVTAFRVGHVDNNSNPSKTIILTACPAGTTLVLAIQVEELWCLFQFLGRVLGWEGEISLSMQYPISTFIPPSVNSRTFVEKQISLLAQSGGGL